MVSIKYKKLIGASLSEPHTYLKFADFVYYYYLSYVIPYITQCCILACLGDDNLTYAHVHMSLLPSVEDASGSTLLLANEYSIVKRIAYAI